jgi:hypothetical protein
MSVLQASVLAIFFAGWLFAHFRGGPPERLAAAIIVGWIAIDTAYHLGFGSSDFNSVDPVHLVLDGAQLMAITWVALRANRMWPLWAAAASLICFSGHLAILIQPVGMRRAYWALTQLPQHIQLLALLLGTVAHARRLRKLGGPYRSWRKA